MISLLQLMRPKQWIKNFFIFAAIIFSGNFLNKDILLYNIIAFLLFCMTSSSVYILNDIVDIEKDKIHPEKCKRPLPCGKISKNKAIVFLIVSLFIVFASAYILVDIKVLLILLLYFVLNIFYSFKLKNVVIIDVMIITFGFVLRVAVGSVATNVEVSPWLFLCTILLSLFLALNKRKSEIITLKHKSSSHRRILDEYSVHLIDKMLAIVTPCILMAYCLYTFSSIQSKTMIFTIPFVLYGIFRYEYLVDKKNVGGKPEDVFGKDISFLINIILWLVSVITIIYLKL